MRPGAEGFARARADRADGTPGGPPTWQNHAAFETELEAILAGLPAAPPENRVRNALYGAHLIEPAELVDDHPNLYPSDPRPFVRVRGDDVALAIQAGPECLVAWRADASVTFRRQPPNADCIPTFGER